MARCSVRKQQFVYEMIHKKGKDDVVPVYLSRALPNITSVESRSVKDPWYQKMVERMTQIPLRYPNCRVE